MGHWRGKCPLVAEAAVSQQAGNKKLSMIDSSLVLMETEIEEEQSFVGGFESEATHEMECGQRAIGDFVEHEHVQVRGNLKKTRSRMGSFRRY